MVDNHGKLTLRHNGRLHHIGVGRTHARTPILSCAVRIQPGGGVYYTRTELVRHLVRMEPASQDSAQYGISRESHAPLREARRASPAHGVTTQQAVAYSTSARVSGPVVEDDGCGCIRLEQPVDIGLLYRCASGQHYRRGQLQEGNCCRWGVDTSRISVS